MFFRDLTARNFRNYREAVLELHPRVNCLIGPNAQGKTNLLEAVYTLAYGRSFRMPDYRNLITWGESEGRLSGTVVRAPLVDEVRLELGGERKRHCINGKQVGRNGKWIPTVVLFAPEEVLLFKEGPDARRECMDLVAQLLSLGHEEAIRQYGRVVQQRNRLLKELPAGGFDTALLEPWDQALVRWGVEVIVGRAMAVEAMNRFLPEAYQRIAPTDTAAQLCYLPCCGEVFREGPSAVMQWFQDALERRRSEELVRCLTLVGPHRDDLAAELGGRALKAFGSQGQHRSLVLALKITEAELCRQRMETTPTFLLDDVTSELDPERTAAFFRYLAETEGQVLWTTTDVATIAGLHSNRKFTVRAGSVVEG